MEPRALSLLEFLLCIGLLSSALESLNFKLRIMLPLSVERLMNQKYYHLFCISSDFMLIGYHFGGWWSK